MPILLIDKIKQKNNGTFKLVDAVDINWEGFQLNTSDVINKATTERTGVVQIGNNISVSDGVISITGTNVKNALEYTPAKQEDVEALTQQFEGGKANAAKEADKLAEAKTIELTGAVTGSTSFDGSTNVTISATLSDLDASKITTGTIDIARLPKGALERLIHVADKTARLALTSEDVQNGDVVKEQDTGVMYYVVDDTKLSEDAGYEEFKAGIATSVPWSGVSDKPSEFKPEAHTQASDTINAMTGYTGSMFDVSDTLNAALKKIEDEVNTKGTPYTLPQATNSVLGGVKIGENITNTTGTISISKENVVSALGYTPPEQDTTYENATLTASGLMSAEDKVKLQNIAEGANNYTLPVASATVLGGVKQGENITIAEDGTISAPTPIDETLLVKKADVLSGDFSGTAGDPSLAEKAVVTSKLADSAVVTAKINDGAVTAVKLGSNAVTDEKIAENALSTSKLFVPAGDVLILDGGVAAL